MYSKLFSSILDSSVWLEDPQTVKVWITFLAAKNSDGFARFATIENLAHRAILSVEETKRAVEILEAPDPGSSNPDHEGRRIERVPGGWQVLNAEFYDEMVRRDDERRSVRERVAAHRARNKKDAPAEDAEPVDEQFERAWTLYPKRGGGNSKASALKAWSARIKSGVDASAMIAGVERYAAYIRAKKDEGTEFVKQTASFFGPARHWEEAWTPPAQRNSSREARNDREIDRFANGE